MSNSENDLSLLTDAERAAMQDDDVTDAIEKEVVAELTADDEPLAASTEEEQPAEEAPAEADSEVVEEVVPEPLPPLEATFRYPNVALTDTVPDSYAQALQNIERQFNDGELEIAAYMAQRTAIDRQITAYQIQEAQQQRDYNQWMDAQDSFLENNRNYTENRVLMGALDSAVRAVQDDARSKGLTPAQILAAADYLVKDSLGMQAQPKPQQPAGKPELKIVKPNNSLPNVPTLSNVPAASANETGSDPFASIDRLTGDARESALAKLSPEQYDAYLRA